MVGDLKVSHFFFILTWESFIWKHNSLNLFTSQSAWRKHKRPQRVIWQNIPIKYADPCPEHRKTSGTSLLYSVATHDRFSCLQGALHTWATFGLSIILRNNGVVMGLGSNRSLDWQSWTHTRICVQSTASGSYFSANCATMEPWRPPEWMRIWS